MVNKCVCSVVPPNILERVALNGKPQQRRLALRSLQHTAAMQGQRNMVGRFIMKAQLSPGTLQRTVYDSGHSANLPGSLVRVEGSQPNSDQSVNNAYDGAGATYEMLMKYFQRNSLDGEGGRLDSSVHYGREYMNAFFNGSQMVYGDGDGEIFLDFTKCIDVIGHEFNHGVTQFTCDLEYWGQSGALNESFSDCMGSLVKQMVLGQTADTADWLIGAGLLGPTINGMALRSMKAPGTAYDDPLLGKDTQPAHMKNYVQTNEDSAGVHTNSGIPNHAFFLMATRMHDSVKAGQIWYKAWTTLMRPRSQFQDCADATAHIALQTFGDKSLEANSVISAWQDVGISPQI